MGGYYYKLPCGYYLRAAIIRRNVETSIEMKDENLKSYVHYTAILYERNFKCNAMKNEIHSSFVKDLNCM